MAKIYETTATNTGARNGVATLSDSDKTFNLVSPADEKQDGVNPEQLFAIGYSACFNGALGLVKKAFGKTFENEVQITVALNKEGDDNFYLSGNIHVIATGDVTDEDLQKIVAKTHEICPYSKAVQGNVDMKLSSEVKQ
ncbi:OsmC family protein [Moraxella macacae 0408225]|uniref:OsmC family protein n=1 Tax=Moraxella macacae 0408225 TaxID=1230338 RepID=L2F994_9GAMM|nr:Ohr family peroxiredoxin [Moraxella macacae]ELA09346.1 OsmC family protein [Moraxella macacae 0408225]